MGGCRPAPDSEPWLFQWAQPRTRPGEGQGAELQPAMGPANWLSGHLLLPGAPPNIWPWTCPSVPSFPQCSGFQNKFFSIVLFSFFCWKLQASRRTKKLSSTDMTRSSSFIRPFEEKKDPDSSETGLGGEVSPERGNEGQVPKHLEILHSGDLKLSEITETDGGYSPLFIRQAVSHALLKQSEKPKYYHECGHGVYPRTFPRFTTDPLCA